MWCVLQCFFQISTYGQPVVHVLVTVVSAWCVHVFVCVFSDSDWGIDRFPSQVIIVFYSAVILYVCLCVCLYVRVWFLGGVGSTGLWLALGSVLSLLQVLLVSAGLSQTLQSPLMQIFQTPPQLGSLPLFLQLPKERRGKRDGEEFKRGLDEDETKIKKNWNTFCAHRNTCEVIMKSKLIYLFNTQSWSHWCMFYPRESNHRKNIKLN